MNELGPWDIGIAEDMKTLGRNLLALARQLLHKEEGDAGLMFKDIQESSSAGASKAKDEGKVKGKGKGKGKGKEKGKEKGNK